MDRETRTILIIAVVVIVALVVLSDRALPVLGGVFAADPGGPDVVVPDIDIPNVAVPTIAPEIDPNMPVNPQSDIQVNPDVAVTSTAPVARPPIRLEQPAGFVSGILHGLIAPFTLVASLFMPTIRMYDVTNSGAYYDVGFLLGLIGLLMIISVRRWRA